MEANSLQICDLEDKGGPLFQIDRVQGSIVEDDYLESCNLEDIRDSLPEHQPRYLVGVGIYDIFTKKIYFFVLKAQNKLKNLFPQKR